MLHTPYGTLTQELADQLAKIRLLICDVDGVFSDGRIYMGNQGEELKAFHTRDGFGVKALLNAGIEVAVITGRKSEIVAQRMNSLGVSHVYQGQDDKLKAFEQLLDKLSLDKQQVGYIGDDVIDLPVMNQCGLAVAVQDAHPIVLTQSDYQTRIRGGFGAVRELSDLILLAQGKLDQAKGTSV